MTPPTEVLFQLIDRYESFLPIVILTFVKSSIFVVIAPPLNSKYIPRAAKLAIIWALALLALPPLERPIPLSAGYILENLAQVAMVGGAFIFAFSLIRVFSQALMHMIGIATLEMGADVEAGSNYEIVLTFMIASILISQGMLAEIVRLVQISPPDPLGYTTSATAIISIFPMAFATAIGIAAPFMMVSLLHGGMAGLAAKLAPQIPVTQIAAPMLTLVGLLLFYMNGDQILGMISRFIVQSLVFIREVP